MGAFKKRIEILEQHKSPSVAMAASPESLNVLGQNSSHHKRNKTHAISNYPLTQAMAGALSMSLKKDNPMQKINQYS